MKIGLADYGLNVWDGALFDIGARLDFLRGLGFAGTERLEAVSASDAINKAVLYRKMGMDFATCRGPSVQAGLEWTCALGKKYVWLGIDVGRAGNFDVFCRRAETMAKAAAAYGITAVLHNHMNQRVENQGELEDFLKACPSVGLLFDVGHLSCAGGDPVEIVRKYSNRIVAMHFKEVILQPEKEQKYQFCELGAGNNGQDTAGIIRALFDAKFDGWMHIEQDSHREDPAAELKRSVEFLRANGVR